MTKGLSDRNHSGNKSFAVAAESGNWWPIAYSFRVPTGHLFPAPFYFKCKVFARGLLNVIVYVGDFRRPTGSAGATLIPSRRCAAYESNFRLDCRGGEELKGCRCLSYPGRRQPNSKVRRPVRRRLVHFFNPLNFFRRHPEIYPRQIPSYQNPQHKMLWRLDVATVMDSKVRVGLIGIVTNEEGHALHPLGMVKRSKPCLMGRLNVWI